MVYSFIIRRAEASDAGDVYAILQKAFREYAEAAGLTEVEALKETIADIEKEIRDKVVYIALIDKSSSAPSVWTSAIRPI